MIIPEHTKRSVSHAASTLLTNSHSADANPLFRFSVHSIRTPVRAEKSAPESILAYLLSPVYIQGTSCSRLPPSIAARFRTWPCGAPYSSPKTSVGLLRLWQGKRLLKTLSGNKVQRALKVKIVAVRSRLAARGRRLARQSTCLTI